MSDVNTRAIVDRYRDAMVANDLEALRVLLHDDYVEDYPQSGEQIRGAANLVGMMSGYPGGIPQNATMDHLVGAEDRWIVSPSYIPMRIDGAGDQYTAVAHVTYPDGSDWYVIQLLRLKDGKVYRTTSYFAPSFAAPDWRAPFVERADPS